MVKDFDIGKLDRLMEEIGSNLHTEVKAYLIGGFAMMKNGIKDSTKDVDIVFNTEEEAKIFIDSAIEIGFLPDKDLPNEYEEMDMITVLRDQEERRFDIFVKQVLKGLTLTTDMQDRGKTIEYSHLKILIGSNEDIFLFKSITSRPADLEDMRNLARTGSIDWKVIEREANNQPTPWRWIGRLYGRLTDLEEEYKIWTPLTNGLQREAEIAAAIELLLSTLQDRTLDTQEAARSLRENDMKFIEAVFNRMKDHGLVTEENGRYQLLAS